MASDGDGPALRRAAEEIVGGLYTSDAALQRATLERFYAPGVHFSDPVVLAETRDEMAAAFGAMARIFSSVMTLTLSTLVDAPARTIMVETRQLYRVSRLLPLLPPAQVHVFSKLTFAPPAEGELPPGRVVAHDDSWTLQGAASNVLGARLYDAQRRLQARALAMGTPLLARADPLIARAVALAAAPLAAAAWPLRVLGLAPAWLPGGDSPPPKENRAAPQGGAAAAAVPAAEAAVEHKPPSSGVAPLDAPPAPPTPSAAAGSPRLPMSASPSAEALSARSPSPGGESSYVTPRENAATPSSQSGADEEEGPSAAPTAAAAAPEPTVVGPGVGQPALLRGRALTTAPAAAPAVARTKRRQGLWALLPG